MSKHKMKRVVRQGIPEMVISMLSPEERVGLIEVNSVHVCAYTWA